MKVITLLLFALLPFCAYGGDQADLSAQELLSKVEVVNAAQNKVMMRGSTEEDVDRLFALYDDDFTYVHEAYGGTYTKDRLYRNTVRNVEDGKYVLDEDRYSILRMIAGRNAVAVERREYTGAVHLSVFEFKGAAVSRIVEYWE